MSDRKYNEEQYIKQQIPGDDLHNAKICSQIADESLVWNPNEAVYSRGQRTKWLLAAAFFI